MRNAAKVCSITLTALCSQSMMLAQAFITVTGQNPMDGRRWVRVEKSATNFYVSNIGSNVTPKFEVECTQDGKKRFISVYLEAGMIGSPTVGNSSDPLLRTKINDGKPRYFSWTPLPDGHTYRYVGVGMSGINTYFESYFLRDVMAGNSLLIQFNPYGTNGDVVTSFSVAGLRDELEKHDECKLPK